MNRRKFIRTGLVGMAGFSVASSQAMNLDFNISGALTVDKVKLGNSGLTASRIAMGTGTVGFNKASNQTRLGMDKFTRLARHAYECGINFYDMADGYGSHPYVGNAIKNLPREKLILSTKVWTYDDGSDRIEPFEKTIDRFRSETGSDYLDIILMHCISRGNWKETRKYYMDSLSKAKQDGIVKAIGLSCHNLEALAEAAINPWVDVIMARINPFGTLMDGTPDAVNAVLETAKKNGKGVVGMKIFGEGKHITDNERQQSIEFALTKGNIHCMTLGLESEAQMDDAIERVMRIVKK
jgi:predicted aldo/keto reductase-like oxidoreductase